MSKELFALDQKSLILYFFYSMKEQSIIIVQTLSFKLRSYTVTLKNSVINLRFFSSFAKLYDSPVQFSKTSKNLNQHVNFWKALWTYQVVMQQTVPSFSLQMKILPCLFFQCKLYYGRFIQPFMLSSIYSFLFMLFSYLLLYTY